VTERKLNAALYFLLAAAVLLYLGFNVFNVRQVFALPEQRIAKEDDIKEDSNLPENVLKEDVSSIELEVSMLETRDISPVGYHLYVDLDLTQLYVYKDGEVIKTYEVSGGKPSTPSPEGTWRIVNKDTWGEGFGGAWLGFNVPWGMYGIHGTTEPWFVGRSNTSKGCIRMKNADVRELFKLIPYNTLVTIVQNNKTFYPMQDGDAGSNVLEVEKALKILGYYNGSEDGIFGETLMNAVKQFQRDYGLYRTGIVNISTYELLRQKVKEVEE
jgi:hypothetical protein